MRAADLDDEVRAVWYSRRGRVSSEWDEEDFQQWLEQLREIRADYAESAEAWLEEWKALGSEGMVWTLRESHVDIFLTMLNDYRLATAARFQIGEAEMTQPWDDITDSIKRNALAEIHLLAVMMECVLQLGDN